VEHAPGSHGGSTSAPRCGVQVEQPKRSGGLFGGLFGGLSQPAMVVGDDTKISVPTAEETAPKPAAPKPAAAAPQPKAPADVPKPAPAAAAPAPAKPAPAGGDEKRRSAIDAAKARLAQQQEVRARLRAGGLHCSCYDMPHQADVGSGQLWHACQQRGLLLQLVNTSSHVCAGGVGADCHPRSSRGRDRQAGGRQGPGGGGAA